MAAEQHKVGFHTKPILYVVGAHQCVRPINAHLIPGRTHGFAPTELRKTQQKQKAPKAQGAFCNIKHYALRMKMSRKVQSGNAQNNGCVDRGKILKPNGAERNEASKSGGSYAAGIFCFSCNRRYTAGGHP